MRIERIASRRQRREQRDGDAAAEVVIARPRNVGVGDGIGLTAKHRQNGPAGIDELLAGVSPKASRRWQRCGDEAICIDAAQNWTAMIERRGRQSTRERARDWRVTRVQRDEQVQAVIGRLAQRGTRGQTFELRNEPCKTTAAPSCRGCLKKSIRCVLERLQKLELRRRQRETQPFREQRSALTERIDLSTSRIA